ncbi:hypothetical protein Chor_010454 [Crotalus horridus]
MDLCSFLEDDDDLLKRMVPFRWEDSDLSLNSLELGQEDSQEDIPGDNGGPLLRCLKRIYRKTKKEKTRRRKALSSGLVPDLSAMATIWEETDDPQSAQEPELLLASWRSSMDKTINWKNMTEFFLDNFTSDVVGAITEMVKQELPEPNIICLQAMNTVTDFSKKHIMKTMGSYKKGLLLRTFFKSVFSLSPVKAGQEEEGVESSTVQYTKNLFIGTYQAFSEMLQQLMVENPILSELERILQLMVPWLQAPEADLRERAIWSSASLLNFVANKLQLETKSKFSHLGHLVAILGICCGDPIKSICSKAAKSIHLLLSIVLGQKIAKLDQKNVHTEVIKWKHQEFLETWNPMVFLKNPSRVAEVFSVYFSPREKTDFLLTILDGLTEACSNFSLSATESLLASIARTCGPEIEKVPDIIEGICSRLNLIRRPSTRRLLMKLVGLLAGRTEHLDTVISTLLEHSFSADSSPSELWRSLSTEEMIEEQLLENLLTRLQSQHKTQLQPPSLSLSALYEVISVLESRDTIRGLFPELLVTFLVELHFSSQRDALPDVDFLQQCGQAIKMLLIRIGCRYEVTFMEKTRGWSMLQSGRELLQGSTLLASPPLKSDFSPEDQKDNFFWWFLDFEKMFFQLLHSQDIDQFPTEQIFENLEEWTQNPSPDVRSLALRALGILVIHPDKVRKQLRSDPNGWEGTFIPHYGSIIWFFGKRHFGPGSQGKGHGIITLHGAADAASFSQADTKVRSSAIVLFSELTSLVKKKEKYLIQEQAMQMVQEACGGPSIALRSQTHFSLDREERLFSQGHWEVPDPALTHRWNPSSPVSHRIITSHVRRRQSGPARQT